MVYSLQHVESCYSELNQTGQLSLFLLWLCEQAFNSHEWFMISMCQSESEEAIGCKTSSSAVADKPARRAASRQTAKV